MLLHENRFQGLLGMEFCSRTYHETQIPMTTCCIPFNVSWDTPTLLQESVKVPTCHLTHIETEEQEQNYRNSN